MRRMLILVALLASGAILSAQERATFIKNDGERITGLLESRTVSRGFFNRSSSFLMNVNNQQVQVPVSDVAVIDFTGGRPSTRELNTLPNDGSQLLVMRNGSQSEGRLVTFGNDDTVRWTDDWGGTENIPMRQISRIYLNPSNARAAVDNSQYGYNNGNRNYQYDQYNQNYGGQVNGLLTPPNGLEVPADVAWTDTGINVRAGDMLSFSANGEVQFGNDQSMRSSANGNGGMRSQSYPVPSMTVGALIGRVGRSAPFAIGGSRRAIQMPANGRLFLGVNDDALTDNSGAFNVVIRGNGQVSSVQNGNGPNGRANGYYRNRGAYGAGGMLTPSNGLQVPATTPWTDTGIDVQAGDMLSFSANGEIRWGTGGGDTANADGNTASMRNSYPLRGAPVGTLIGRVGNSAPFPVGTNTGAIRMPVNGRLFLGINDDDRRDNSGAFNVVVRYAR